MVKKDKPKGWTGDKKGHSDAAKRGWQKRYEKMPAITDAEISEVQGKRKQKTKDMDGAFTAKRTFNRDDPRARPWLKNPGRFDIQDVDTRMLARAGLELTGDENADELNTIIEKAQEILLKRAKKPYLEVTIDANAFKGTGKCWIQRYTPDGVRGDFMDPVNVEKPSRYKTEKTFRLPPGLYLVNEAGSKSQDRRYKMLVKPDLTVEFPK